MPTYDIKVTVEYQYEVEAENEAEAEEQGWHYEDYAYSGEVYSIEVDEQPYVVDSKKYSFMIEGDTVFYTTIIELSNPKSNSKEDKEKEEIYEKLRRGGFGKISPDRDSSGYYLD